MPATKPGKTVNPSKESVPMNRKRIDIPAFMIALLLAATVSAEELKPYTETLNGAKVQIEMVPIQAGKFMMGSPAGEEGRQEHEPEPFEVRMDAFWMAKLEVTWDQYNKFRAEYDKHLEKKLDPKKADKKKWADAVSIPTPLWEQDSTPILTGMGMDGGYPAADISPYGARQFSKWVSRRSGKFYRLPTEAEWEYACRAGSKAAYSFGDDPDKLDACSWNFDNALYDDPDKGHPDYGAGYRKVGTKKANAWGLHDMHGNVAEWVIDQHDESFFKKMAGKSVTWQEAINWPKVVFPRIAKGGHWKAGPEGCRSASRILSNMKELQDRDPQIPKSIWWYTDSFHIGFRLVRPAKEPSAEEQLKYWEACTEDEFDVLNSGKKEVRALLEVK